MFDSEWSGYDAAATLDAVAEYDAAENDAALGKLKAALHFADLHQELPQVSQDAPAPPGGERLVVYGGEGCPAIGEFAPVELGPLLKISSRAAASYLGEALALRHRFPRLWAKTLNGEAVVWRARQIARTCTGLSAEAAALIDCQVVAIIDTLTGYRLQKIIDAVILELDPAAAQKAAEEYARSRGIWVHPSDYHGTKTIYVKAAAGDVIRFDATINDLAWALAVLGDTDTIDERRAKALGWIADPAAAHELIAAARFLAAQHPGAQRSSATLGQENTSDGDVSSECSRQENTCGDSPRPASDQPGPRGSECATECGPDNAGSERGGPERSDPVSGSTEDRASESGGSGWSAEDQAGAGDQTADGDHLPGEWLEGDEPGPDYEADREPDYEVPDDMANDRGADHRLPTDPDDFTRLSLAGRLAAIKHAAHTTGLGAGHHGRRPTRNVLYTHLTDEALFTGSGLLRVEEYGPLLAAQLRELVGHDHITIQPVIDLKDQIRVDAYEIPTRIRERMKLTYPVEQFPYGSTETTLRTDLDHIRPYNPNGPPEQTGTDNLVPLNRHHHRAKTHGRWQVRRTPDGALEWTSPNGLQFRVDKTGTRRIKPGNLPPARSRHPL